MRVPDATQSVAANIFISVVLAWQYCLAILAVPEFRAAPQQNRTELIVPRSPRSLLVKAERSSGQNQINCRHALWV